MANQIINKNIKLALFDICNTTVNTTTITDFCENFLLSKKNNPYFSYRKMLWHLFCKILRRFKLCKPDFYRNHWIKLFKGYYKKQIDELAEKYLLHLKTIIKDGVINEMRDLRDKGYQIYLVSAGLNAYLWPFANFLNLPLICSKVGLDKYDKYTGKLSGVDCIGEGKVEKINQEIPVITEVDWQESVSYGDSFDDIPLLSLTGKSIVVDPGEKLKNFAKKKNWRILNTK